MDGQAKFFSQATGFVDTMVDNFEGSFDRMTVSLKDAASFFKKEMKDSSSVFTLGFDQWFNGNNRKSNTEQKQRLKRDRKFENDETKRKRTHNNISTCFIGSSILFSK